MKYTIKKVAEKFDLTEYAIRYYEKEGLLPNIARDEHGIRNFSEDDIEWIKLICCLRNTGMAISNIKNFVTLCMEGDGTLELRREIILAQKKITEQKIKEMNNNLEMINWKLNHYTGLINEKKANNCCCNSMDSCKSSGTAV
jgi:DNA-binding transcriptional MerR regulator